MTKFNISFQFIQIIIELRFTLLHLSSRSSLMTMVFCPYIMGDKQKPQIIHRSTLSNVHKRKTKSWQTKILESTKVTCPRVKICVMESTNKEKKKKTIERWHTSMCYIYEQTERTILSERKFKIHINYQMHHSRVKSFIVHFFRL